MIPETEHGFVLGVQLRRNPREQLVAQLGIRHSVEGHRRKIFVGAAILARVESGKWPKDRLLEMMSEALTRAGDRAMLDLPQLPEK